MEACTFQLCLYAEDADSSAVAFTSLEELKFCRNRVEFGHTQGVAVDANAVKAVAVDECLLLGAAPGQPDRRLSTSIGIRCSAALSVRLSRLRLSGLRLGLSLKDSCDVRLEGVEARDGNL